MTWQLLVIVCWSATMPDPLGLGARQPAPPACYRWDTHDDARYPTLDACERQAQWWIDRPVLLHQVALMDLMHRGELLSMRHQCTPRSVL